MEKLSKDFSYPGPEECILPLCRLEAFIQDIRIQLLPRSRSIFEGSEPPKMGRLHNPAFYDIYWIEASSLLLIVLKILLLIQLHTNSASIRVRDININGFFGHFLAGGGIRLKAVCGAGATRSRSFLLKPEPVPKKNYVYGSGSGNYPKETLP